MKHLYKIMIAGFLVFNLFPTLKAGAQMDSAMIYVSGNPVICSLPGSIDININYYSDSSDTIYFNLDFGDGQNSNFATYNHSYWNTVSHTYTLAGNYQVMFTATDDSGHVEKDSLNIFASNTCGTISGTFYVDDNDNCIKDAGENTPLQYSCINLWYQDQVISTTYADGAGYYEFLDIPAGYDYVIVPYQYYYSGGLIYDFCPEEIQISSVPSSNNNIGYYCPTTDFDLLSNLNCTGFVPGQSRHIDIHTNRLTCSPNNTATVKLILNPLLTYDNSHSTPIPVTTSGDTVMYNVNFGSGSSIFNWIWVITSPTATLGDTLCVEIITEPVLGDIHPENNRGNFCFPVNTSCDPNDKIVYPRGIDPAGNIDPDQTLTYTINFQNTGTEYAYNIFLDDTLDSNLDLSTFRVLSSSHYMYLSWPAPNIVRFQYDNIYLPDSTMDEPNSHGYVIYSIDPLPGLTIGTEITNSADIFFDYNLPVKTNTVINTIADLTQVPVIKNEPASFSIYPNPVTDFANITINEKGSFSLEINDITGKVIKIINNVLSGESNINLRGLGSGIYFVKLISSDKQTIGVKKVSVE